MPHGIYVKNTSYLILMSMDVYRKPALITYASLLKYHNNQLPQPSSKLVIPKILSNGSMGAGPLYILAVSKTGLMP